MQTKQTAEQDFIDEWVLEGLIKGKSIEEMHGTTFVFGKEVLTLKKNAEGSFDVEPLETKDVVVFQESLKGELANLCHACGTEHQTFKEALQCCENMD